MAMVVGNILKYLYVRKIIPIKFYINYFCRKNDIKDYSINVDNTINIQQHINYDIKLKIMKGFIKVDRINSDFIIVDYKDNKSLVNSPIYVVGNFGCCDMKLDSIKGGPEYITGDLYCINNNIRTFEGFPKYLGGGFKCDNNPIHSVWKLFYDKHKIELFNDYDIIRDDGKTIIIDRLNDFLVEVGKKPFVKNKFTYGIRKHYKLI